MLVVSGTLVFFLMLATNLEVTKSGLLPCGSKTIIHVLFLPLDSPHPCHRAHRNAWNHLFMLLPIIYLGDTKAAINCCKPGGLKP